MSDTIDQIPELPAGASPVAPGTLAKGVPFDPARHIPRTSKITGAWMPKGGRKPKNAAPSSGSTSSPPAPTAPGASANSSPSPLGSPGASVGIDELIPLPDAPKPAPAASPDAAKAAAQPGPAPIPDVGPSDAPGSTATPAAGPSGASPRGGDVNMGHEAAGELAARVVYSVTGAVTGNHKAATASGDEHKNIKGAFAAFFAHRGVAFVGGVALLLVIIAYALGEARKEEIFATIRKFTGRKNTGPVVDVKATPVPETKPEAGESAAETSDAPRSFFGR